MNAKCIIISIVSFYLTIDRGLGVLIGMLAPIEVVEEWTCHDQPIHLTCGHLDSLVTVLEATFTPNCTDTDEDACNAFNALAQSYIMEHRNEHQFLRQMEMGRKFLRELRQIHEDTVSLDTDSVASMRASLEQLLEKFLLKAAPERRNDYEARRRRHLTNLTTLEDDEDNEVDDSTTTSTAAVTAAANRPSICLHNRRRISHLDKIELENSLKPDSEIEFNIRNAVNYRCSGKNHCSFIFASDHPLSIIWNSGLVRIKYACMDNFRIARYCNEKLLIDNEVELPVFLQKHDELENMASGSGAFEEPRAEARVQLDTSSNFHQFTNLKILTPAEDPALQKKKKPRVYSQDFQRLKILQMKPSDEITNEIEEQTELYIKREDIFEVATTQGPEDGNTAPPTNTVLAPTNQTMLDYEIVIREGKETITLFPDTFHKLLNPVQTLSSSRTSPSIDTTKLVSPFLHVTTAPPVAAPPADWREDIERKYPDVLDSNEIIKDDMSAMESITENFLENLEDYDESHMDYRKVYSSIQRTSSGKPLLQGFIMSPGYPKYYIGSFDCKWRIIAPVQQKIRLTIFDLALRYDDICKDFLEVNDVESNSLLFNGCKESNKPIEIVSISNELEISFKTVSKLAYPKRGVLLHYSVLGCLVPPIPPNVHLVQRSEHILTFDCDPNFVFPDTANTTRDLTCTERHMWDKTLPNCVEQNTNEGSGTVARFNQAKSENRINTRMTDTSADMLYDIVIPSILIGVLFVVNAVVFMIIMHYRRRRSDDQNDKELAEL